MAWKVPECEPRSSHPTQAIVQSGHQPSVLQQLCNLPINYFSQPELKRLLFPTLLAACHANEANTGVLTEEMSYGLLREYVDSDEGKGNHLVQLITSAVPEKQ